MDRQKCHDLVARQRRSASCLRVCDGKLPDASLELIDEPLEASRPLRVTRGAIVTNEQVQVAEQRSGVNHVAAHCTVGPARPEALEAAAQLYEAGHVVHEFVVESHGVESSARDAGADGLVMAEGHPARPHAVGGGLADVVQERSGTEAQLRRRGGRECDRVGEDVLVAMHRILFHLHRDHLGNPALEEAVGHHADESLGRIRLKQDLAEAAARAGLIIVERENDSHKR